MVWKVLTREDLINDVRLALGEPIIRVEVTDDHIRRNIDAALKEFWKYHPHGTVERYMIYQATEDDVTNGFIPTPEDWETVVEIIPQGYVSGQGWMNPEWHVAAGAMNSPGYALSMTGLNQSPGGNFNGHNYLNRWSGWNQVTLGDWLIAKNFMQAIQMMSGSNMKRFTFSKYERKIWPLFTYRENEIIVVRVYQIVDPDTSGGEAYDSEWLKAYVVALTKQTWGGILRKFQGVTLPGGVSISGDVLVAEGKEEQKDLDDQIMSQWPVDFVIA